MNILECNFTFQNESNYLAVNQTHTKKILPLNVLLKY